MNIGELKSRIDHAKDRLESVRIVLAETQTICGIGDIPGITCRGPLNPGIPMPEFLRDLIRGTVVLKEGTADFITEWAKNTGDPLAWGTEDWLADQVERQLSSDPEYLRNYKNEWVRTYADDIQEAAERHDIPPELLAGVAWVEAGGQPDSLDNHVYNLRKRFPWLESLDDQNLPGPLDRLTGPPEETSFGTIQMQIRVAAQELGYPDPDNLSTEQEHEIIEKLQEPETNIDLVARHLDSLRNHDGFPADPDQLTDEQIAVIATRYNRGVEPSLEDIQANPDYGNLLIRLRNEGLLENLLN